MYTIIYEGTKVRKYLVGPTFVFDKILSAVPRSLQRSRKMTSEALASSHSVLPTFKRHSPASKILARYSLAEPSSSLSACRASLSVTHRTLNRCRQRYRLAPSEVTFAIGRQLQTSGQVCLASTCTNNHRAYRNNLVVYCVTDENTSDISRPDSDTFKKRVAAAAAALRS